MRNQPTQALESISVTIGAKVRAARAELRISRKRLAELAAVSERYLNQLENGDANVSVGILSRVAAALDIDLADFFAQQDAPPSHGTGLNGQLRGVLAEMSGREQEGAVPVLERYLRERRKSLRGIALLGLRGAGKTTIGGIFARRHGLKFLSVTREIETRAGMSLPDLFNLGGPDAYRTLENEVVKELSSQDERIVLETAGGIVSNSAALEVILGSFRTVWLKASPEEHLQRVIHQGDMRPMRGTPQALEHLKTLLAQREQEYARADCVLDTSGVPLEHCVQELERIAGERVLADVG